jgi:hypothetical protein
MALSRLLLPKPGLQLHLRKIGKTHFMKTIIVHKRFVFLKETFSGFFACNVISGLPQSSKRWCSSSSPLSSGGTEQSSHPKEAARERRAVTTEPDVKK